MLLLFAPTFVPSRSTSTQVSTVLTNIFVFAVKLGLEITFPFLIFSRQFFNILLLKLFRSQFNLFSFPSERERGRIEGDNINWSEYEETE